MGYQLGIDLGTTYTAAAVCRSDDRRWVEPEVVTLGTRSATIASVLYLAPDGSVVVGEAAERRALTDPDRVVREFKRRVGDPTPLVVGGRAWVPEELSARLVRWVVDRVAEREGGPATRVAVTHPASWGPHKRDLLGHALAAQGVAVTFLSEPQAAALHYASAERVEPGSTIAVYDLGGGTFDAAVVRKAETGRAASGAAGFGLLGRPEGLERLGGIDFDDAVFEHVRDALPEVFADLDDTDPAVLSAVSRVRRDCTEAKEALSSDTEVSIPVLLPGSRGSVRLHRSEFESLIRPHVEKTVSALRAAVASAGSTPDQLSAVLLVGGSSRIPLVAQLVSEQLGRPVAVDADPKNAIAKGAALAVSPTPTASWPGIAVAPVAAVGSAVAAGSVAAGAGVPRPPRPPQGGYTPPQGVPRPQGDQPYGDQFSGDRSSYDSDETVAFGGPTHELATALLSGADRRPARPPARPEPEDDWYYDDEPEPRRRPLGLLVGVGGLLAVVVVVAAVLLWPQIDDTTVGGVGGRSTAGQVPGVTVPTEDPAAGEAGTGTGTDPGTGGTDGSGDTGAGTGGGAGGASDGAGGANGGSAGTPGGGDGGGDPVDPGPGDPVDPVDPGPGDPVDPVDPGPGDPVDPLDPVDPVDPGPVTEGDSDDATPDQGLPPTGTEGGETVTTPVAGPSRSPAPASPGPV